MKQADASFDIYQILAPEGAVARSLSGFERRGEQVEMAGAIGTAFDGAGHLVVEAGTGVGKSFAYLIPAIERVGRKAGKILVSTFTITLQEQLINKDIPFLADVLPVGFTAVLAKGRGNYLCKRRLDFAFRRQRLLFDKFGEFRKSRYGTRLAASTATAGAGGVVFFGIVSISAPEGG
jgi:ATP-dependent DNA helicase DinG